MKPNFSWRLAKWTEELSEFDILYQPRIAIKAQALVDFLAKLPNLELTSSRAMEEVQVVWKVFMDGSVGVEGSRVGVFLISPSGEEMWISVCLRFKVSNNEAEYKAVLYGLQTARAVGPTRVRICSDSQLVTSQIQGSFAIKDDHMPKYAAAYKQINSRFSKVQIQRIPREENVQADELAQLATSLKECTSWDPLHLELAISLAIQGEKGSTNEEVRMLTD